jgi:hypothetical protein
MRRPGTAPFLRGGERGRLLRWSATTSDSTRCSRVSNSQMLTDSATPVRRVRLGVLSSRGLAWPHLVAASQWLCPALERSRCSTSRFTYQDMPLQYNPCFWPAPPCLICIRPLLAGYTLTPASSSFLVPLSARLICMKPSSPPGPNTGECGITWMSIFWTPLSLAARAGA